MTILTEGRHDGEFILSEAEAGRSRDNVTVAASQTVTPATLLAALAVPAKVSAVASADAGNTASSGTIAMDTTATTSEAISGRYVGIATAATKVEWEDPEGRSIGVSTHGSLFAKGGVRFTITAGDSANVAGDRFYIDVQVEPGDIEYVAYNPSGTDGSQTPSAVAVNGVVTGSGETAKIAAIARAAQVKSAALAWPAGITSSQKSAAVTALSKAGIIVR